MKRRAIFAVLSAFLAAGVLVAQQPASNAAKPVPSQPAPLAGLAAPTSQPSSTPALPPMRYFAGESKVTWPDGRVVGAMFKVLERTRGPSGATVRDRLIILHPIDPTREVITTYKIDGDKFTCEDEERRYTGKGELAGPATARNGMSYTVNFSDGSGYSKTVETWAVDRLTAKIEFYGPEDRMRVQIAEELHEISSDAYQLLRKNLLKTP